MSLSLPSERKRCKIIAFLSAWKSSWGGETSSESFLTEIRLLISNSYLFSSYTSLLKPIEPSLQLSFGEVEHLLLNVRMEEARHLEGDGGSNTGSGLTYDAMCVLQENRGTPTSKSTKGQDKKKLRRQWYLQFAWVNCWYEVLLWKLFWEDLTENATYQRRTQNPMARSKSTYQ